MSGIIEKTEMLAMLDTPNLSATSRLYADDVEFNTTDDYHSAHIMRPT